MNVSRKRKRPVTARALKCECCGRIIVLLRRPDAETGTIRLVACYVKTWDGNPWYVPGIHARHPKKRYRIFKIRERQGGGGEPDPFFRLD